MAQTPCGRPAHRVPLRWRKQRGAGRGPPARPRRRPGSLAAGPNACARTGTRRPPPPPVEAESSPRVPEDTRRLGPPDSDSRSDSEGVTVRVSLAGRFLTAGARHGVGREAPGRRDSDRTCMPLAEDRCSGCGPAKPLLTDAGRAGARGPGAGHAFKTGPGQPRMSLRHGQPKPGSLSAGAARAPGCYWQPLSAGSQLVTFRLSAAGSGLAGRLGPGPWTLPVTARAAMTGQRLESGGIPRQGLSLLAFKSVAGAGPRPGPKGAAGDRAANVNAVRPLADTCTCPPRPSSNSSRMLAFEKLYGSLQFYSVCRIYRGYKFDYKISNFFWSAFVPFFIVRGWDDQELRMLSVISQHYSPRL